VCVCLLLCSMCTCGITQRYWDIHESLPRVRCPLLPRPMGSWVGGHRADTEILQVQSSVCVRVCHAVFEGCLYLWGYINVCLWRLMCAYSGVLCMCECELILVYDPTYVSV